MNVSHVLVKPERRRKEIAYAWLISYGPPAIVATASILLVGRLFRLISRYAVNIFFWDEWDLKNVTLFQTNSLWQMFAWQHGWHRLGLGALLEKLLNPLFQWNSRTESFLLGGILAVTAIFVLWLKTRLYGRFSIFDVVIPAILFTPAQWETLYITPIFSQGPLPFFLIVAYCLAWTCERSALRYPVVLLINFVTIYTGFGIFLGVITPVLLALDCWSQPFPKSLTRACFIAALVISLASLGSFFLGYKLTPGISCFSEFQPSSLRSYMAFAALIEANFFALRTTGTFPRFVGATVFIALLTSLLCAVSVLVRRNAVKVPKSEHARLLVVTALTAVSATSCATIAYLRLCAGLQTALSPRYAVYVQLGILGLYFHLLGLRNTWSRRCLLTVLLVLLVVSSLHSDREAMVYLRDNKQRWKTCYLQIEDIKQCNDITGFVIYPPPAEHTRLHEKLQYLKKARQNLYLDQKTP